MGEEVEELDALIAQLDDERDLLKDCSRIQGELSALDPFTAQLIANTMWSAARQLESLRASLTRAEAEREELQSALWSVLKDRRDSTSQLAERAEQELQEAIARGWDSHLPTLEEVQAAGPYVHVRADETLEEATERAYREGRLSRASGAEGSALQLGGDELKQGVADAAAKSKE